MNKQYFPRKKSKIKNDIILVAVIVSVAVAGLFILKATEEKGASVAVLYDGAVLKEYSITENVEEEILTGDNGEWMNTLVIKNGKVRVKSANCPDGICVDHREISNLGETIICLPHKVVVEIK